jgi:hypothetical protein
MRAKSDESLAGHESVVTAFFPVGILLKNLLVKIREFFGILGKNQDRIEIQHDLHLLKLEDPCQFIEGSHATGEVAPAPGGRP